LGSRASDPAMSWRRVSIDLKILTNRGPVLFLCSISRSACKLRSFQDVHSYQKGCAGGHPKFACALPTGDEFPDSVQRLSRARMDRLLPFDREWLGGRIRLD